MTENVTTMPAPAPNRMPTAEEERIGLDRMAARADQMEKICRGLMRDATVSYVRDKADLDMRHRDERAQLEMFHVKRMAELERSLSRIEALRGA